MGAEVGGEQRQFAYVSLHFSESYCLVRLRRLDHQLEETNTCSAKPERSIIIACSEYHHLMHIFSDSSQHLLVKEGGALDNVRLKDVGISEGPHFLCKYLCALGSPSGLRGLFGLST